MVKNKKKSIRQKIKERKKRVTEGEKKIITRICKQMVWSQYIGVQSTGIKMGEKQFLYELSPRCLLGRKLISY